MKYEDARKSQIEYFEKGVYLILVELENHPGSFVLIPTPSKTLAQNSIDKPPAEVRRFPLKLRVFPGGKN